MPTFFRGLKLPLIEENGKIGQFVIDDDLISQSLFTILSTSRYERVLKPDLFTNLKSFLFENIDSFLLEAIRSEIMTAISKYEKRVVIKNITFFEDANESTRIVIQIDYITIFNSQSSTVFVSRERNE